MPTIEVVCLEQTKPLKFQDFCFPFPLRAESEPVSHRGLFYKELRKLNGCIYHLSNPDMRGEDSWFYASDLLDWECGNDDRLKFLPEFITDIRRLLNDLLDASPLHRLTFSSDYQFGPVQKRFPKALCLDAFWKRHDAGELRLNAKYFLH